MQTRRAAHLPNILTALRGLLVVPVVLLMLKRTDGADWVAFIVFTLAAATDRLDGALARRWEVVSSAGQFLDPLVDKVLVIVSMAALVYLTRFPAWAAIVILIREVSVTLLRVAASRRGRGFPADRLAKWKTTLQLIAVAAYMIPSQATAWRVYRTSVLAAAVALTLVTGWTYFRRAPSMLRHA